VLEVRPNSTGSELAISGISGIRIRRRQMVPFNLKRGKVLLLSFPSVGPGADPSVQAVSPQVTSCHPPGSRLPLLFARSAVTFPAE